MRVYGMSKKKTFKISGSRIPNSVLIDNPIAWFFSFSHKYNNYQSCDEYLNCSFLFSFTRSSMLTDLVLIILIKALGVLV